MDSVNALMAGLIDYAGLFPPAGLAMREAVANYAEYLSGPDSVSLGSFIVQAERLEEFIQTVQPYVEGGKPPKTWFLSVLVREDVPAALEKLKEIGIDSKGTSFKSIRLKGIEIQHDLLTELPEKGNFDFENYSVYAEVPVGDDVERLIPKLRDSQVNAKMRTGGVTEAAIPSTYHVIRFMRVCSNTGVAFKATAGLHHPLRAKFPLTYEPNGPRATMFGFLNVFLAAAFMFNGADDATAARILEESDPAAFTFTPSKISWGGLDLSTNRITAARDSFARSFGSCSFKEPVDELELLLPAPRA